MPSITTDVMLNYNVRITPCQPIIWQYITICLSSCSTLPSHQSSDGTLASHQSSHGTLASHQLYVTAHYHLIVAIQYHCLHLLCSLSQVHTSLQHRQPVHTHTHCPTMTNVHNQSTINHTSDSQSVTITLDA